MTVGQEEFRRSLAAFATGVGVVTCLAEDQDHAMTANAIASVSLEPPLILVGVNRSARFWEALRGQEHWALSVLAADAQPHAAWLATSGRPLSGQLDEVPHHRSARGIALLDQSLVWLECRTYDTVAAGDHMVVIGEVENARPGPDADALLYWRSHYRRLSP